MTTSWPIYNKNPVAANPADAGHRNRCLSFAGKGSVAWIVVAPVASARLSARPTGNNTRITQGNGKRTLPDIDVHRRPRRSTGHLSGAPLSPGGALRANVCSGPGGSVYQFSNRRDFLPGTCAWKYSRLLWLAWRPEPGLPRRPSTVSSHPGKKREKRLRALLVLCASGAARRLRPPGPSPLNH